MPTPPAPGRDPNSRYNTEDSAQNAANFIEDGGVPYGTPEGFSAYGGTEGFPQAFDDVIKTGNQLFNATVNPMGTGKSQAAIDFIQSGARSGQLGGYNAALQPVYQQGAQRVQANNPYNTQRADISRGLGINQLNQLRDNTQNGPSVAGLMTNRGMGANLQAALGAGGGAAVRNQASAVGSGLAQQGGAGRLAEMMAGQAAYGQGAGNLRSNDIRSANNSVQAGQRAQGLADQNSRKMGELGVSSAEAARRNALEQYKLLQRLTQSRQGQNSQTQKDVINFFASMLGMSF